MKGNRMENEKIIWVFHHYATPPNLNGFTRPHSFAMHLKDLKYSFRIFSASQLHFSNENLISDGNLYKIDKSSGIEFVYIKTPSSQGNGFKRIKNMFSYYHNLFKVTKKLLKTEHKPDLILSSSPHPLALVAGIKIAKKLKIPSIVEIRDFWPEVFFLGGKLKENGFLGKLLLRGERWIYRKADAIVFLKEGDYKYVIDRKWDIENGGDIDLKKCYYINNGVNLSEFNNAKSEYVYDDKDLNDEKKFNIVYAGAIRPINNIGFILDVAKNLMDHSEIQFIIFGEGSELEILKERVRTENIKNLVFKGFIDRKYIPNIISKSSINILNYSNTRYNWSRGNSSNKLFEYMAAGKPIISTVKMGFDLIERYNCGISLNQTTVNDLSKAILEIYELNFEDYNRMGQNALIAANDFDYKNLAEKLRIVIDKYLYYNVTGGN